MHVWTTNIFLRIPSLLFVNDDITDRIIPINIIEKFLQILQSCRSLYILINPMQLTVKRSRFVSK